MLWRIHVKANNISHLPDDDPRFKVLNVAYVGASENMDRALHPVYDLQQCAGSAQPYMSSH